MRALWVAAAMATLIVYVPPAAVAAITTRIPAAPIEGPVVAAGEAVWADWRGYPSLGLFAARPGGTVRRVAAFPSYQTAGGDGTYSLPQLSSSGNQIAVSVDTEPIPYTKGGPDEPPPDAKVLAGPPSGPFDVLLDCQPGMHGGPASAVGDGTVIASGPGCDAAHASALGLRTDGSVAQPLTPNGTRVRAAGRFVGWITSWDVVVYDVDRRAVAYRVTTPQYSKVLDWDLGPDGKVAIALAGQNDLKASLSWYSPEEPFAHPLAVPAAASWTVHMDGQRIAYLRSAGPRGSDFYFGELGVADFAGNAHTIAERAMGWEQGSAAYTGGGHSAFAFDGSTVTWAGPECIGAALHAQSIDEAPAMGPRPRCALAFRRGPRLLEKRAVRLPLVCSGFAPACGGTDVKLETSAQHLRLGRDSSRSCDDTADVQLNRRGLRLLRRMGALRVRAIATTTDLSGAREVRTAAFTLRARGGIAHDHACQDY